MGLLDLSDFEDLLRIQAERSELAEELTPEPRMPLTEKVRLAKISRNKEEIERKNQAENLPDDYFFSEMAELVLEDDDE